MSKHIEPCGCDAQYVPTRACTCAHESMCIFTYAHTCWKDTYTCAHIAAAYVLPEKRRKQQIFMHWPQQGSARSTQRQHGFHSWRVWRFLRCRGQKRNCPPFCVLLSCPPSRCMPTVRANADRAGIPVVLTAASNWFERPKRTAPRQKILPCRATRWWISEKQKLWWKLEWIQPNLPEYEPSRCRHKVLFELIV